MTNEELIAEANRLGPEFDGWDCDGSAAVCADRLDLIGTLAAALEASEARIAELEAQAKDRKAEQVFRISELQELGEAQARIAELEAGEWEYGLRTRSKSDPVRGFFSYAGDLETAWEMYGATYEHCTATIVRRRKAGPWVPVESEGE